MLRKATFIIMAVAVSGAMPARGDDTCKQGYVWRDAFSGDHVCVTPQVRQQAADDNRRAASRLDPQNPGSCIQGYVWREASPSDHVCVTPAVRAQAAADNQAAGSRVAVSMSATPGAWQHAFQTNATDVVISWSRGANGSHPPNAVLGGWEKWESQSGSTEVRTDGPLYICRAAFDGAVYVGKIVKNACNFGAEGKEHTAGSYEVMTWKSSRDSLGWRRGGSTPPAGALAGGRSPAGHDVFICRIAYASGIHPGWQVPGRDACSIGYGGNEIQRPGMSYVVPQKGKPIDE